MNNIMTYVRWKEFWVLYLYHKRTGIALDTQYLVGLVEMGSNSNGRFHGRRWDDEYPKIHMGKMKDETRRYWLKFGLRRIELFGI